MTLCFFFAWLKCLNVNGYKQRSVRHVWRVNFVFVSVLAVKNVSPSLSVTTETDGNCLCRSVSGCKHKQLKALKIALQFFLSLEHWWSTERALSVTACVFKLRQNSYFLDGYFKSRYVVNHGVGKWVNRCFSMQVCDKATGCYYRPADDSSLPVKCDFTEIKVVL